MWKEQFNIEVLDENDIFKSTGHRPDTIIYDDLIKEETMTRNNNAPELHEAGLQKRIANYQTQQTIRTMRNSPQRVAHKKRVNYFSWVVVSLLGHKNAK